MFEESLKAFKNLIYINTNDVDEEMFSSTNIINKLSSESIEQVYNIKLEFYNSNNSITYADVKNNFIFNDAHSLDKLNKLSQKKPNSKKVNDKKKLLGRKRLDAQYTEIGHDKHSEDNKMRKLKTNLLEYILIELNESLMNKKYKIYRIDKFICECLRRDYNLKLLQRTIEDIFTNSKISNKYRIEIDKDINKNTIKRILSEKQEADTIHLLKKKFIDIINDIRGVEQNLIKFFNRIKEKEYKMKRKEKNLDKYISSLKELLLGYEKWFKNKKGRRRNKSQLFKIE